jgi:sn-glycerol 3-phosphate transport system substrate-binding protein
MGQRPGQDFNAGQKGLQIVPTFKGAADESMTAAIAAFRADNSPTILQVFVGTATMMASKGPWCRVSRS